MRRVFSLRVWVILALALFTAWGEQASEAQLLRGRRQRCCCPAPCKESCREYCCPRGPEKLCMVDELFGSEGYYIYYAHYHSPDGDYCPNYEGVITEAYDQHPNLPEVCNYCDIARAHVSSAIPGLPAPIAKDKDLADYMGTSKATKLEELAGNIKLTSGREIHARVGIFKVTAKIKETADGPEKDVTEYFGFGFEAADTNRREFHAQQIGKHHVGAQEQKFLTEFKIGTFKCVVLTSQ
jgi:hypothetical protein